MNDRFSLVQRVRFGDLDAMQHMNNVEFLRFFETARIEYITGLLPEHSPGKREQFGFIFAECPGGSAPYSRRDAVPRTRIAGGAGTPPI